MSVNQDIRDELPDDAIVFDNYAYDNSIIGVTLDGRAIYAYEQMVVELMNAIEWIDYNTIRALPYYGDNAPVVVSLLV